MRRALLRQDGHPLVLRMTNSWLKI